MSKILFYFFATRIRRTLRRQWRRSVENTGGQKAWAGTWKVREIRHDTIGLRYVSVDLRALKSWRDGQLNLAHGPEIKNNEKIKIKNQLAQKKRCRQKSVEAVREEVKLRGVGFARFRGIEPQKFLKIFGQHSALWFVLGKKMCSFHWLLGVKDIASTPVSNIRGQLTL